MKDPISLTAAASAAAAGAAVGEIAGLPIDALIFGGLGGIVAVLVVPSAGARPATGLSLMLALATTIVVSVIVAAALGPLTAAYCHLPQLDPLVELRAFSFLWAAGAQAGLLTTAIDSMRRRLAQMGGADPGNGQTPTGAP